MGYGNGIIGGGGGERDGVQWRREILFGIQQLTLKVKRYLAWDYTIIILSQIFTWMFLSSVFVEGIHLTNRIEKGVSFTLLYPSQPHLPLHTWASFLDQVE